MTGTIIWLMVASLALSGLAVVLDRVNFPQKPFRARHVVTEGGETQRDRTGAHIVYLDGPADEMPDPADPRPGHQPAHPSPHQPGRG